MEGKNTNSRFQNSGKNANQGRFSKTQSNGKKKVNYKGGYTKKVDSTFALCILGFILGILPLITKCKSYNIGLETFDWFSGTKSSIDVFLYYKQFFFAGILAIMVFAMIYSLCMEELTFEFHPIFVPLWVYAGCSLLSTLISSYRDFGFSGIFEQFENVFCLIGYVAVVFFVYFYIKTDKDIHILINVLAVGALVIGVIGMFQGFKLDFFRSDLGKSLIASSDVPAEILTFSFDLGRAYVTLYNPNYVGVYCILLIPLFAVMVAFARNYKERILYIADVVTLLISMFAAQFKAGIVSLGVVVLIAVVLLRKILLKKWFLVLPAILVAVGMFVLVDNVNEHVYSTSIQQAFKVEKYPQAALSDIKLGKKSVDFTYNDVTYTVTCDILSANEDGSVITYGNFAATKKDGTIMNLIAGEDGITRFEDAGLASVYMFNSGSYYWIMTVDGYNWNFVQREDGVKYFNYYGKETTIEKADSAVFDGYEGFASKRGYIWEKTIPLLKKYLFLGSGADTFIIEFPQHDYVDAHNAGYDNQLISKPHCWYLQVGVQTGVISMIAIIVFYLMYFGQSVVLYSKKIYDSYMAKVGVAIFLGTIGYMIAGLTNDSSITVAPIFWTVIGIGVSINIMVSKEVKNRNNEEV
ncbi:MAG: O-antigen ligase family protein [Lachnospiraceae bacterium]|nr:O-antigen ligase family protein [Lachnospiraceae bacterium]